MFEDFERKDSETSGGRRGVSALLTIGVFGGLSLLIGGAVTAHQVHRARVEREQQVTFSDLPTVKAPKPKALVKAKVAKRAPAKRAPVANLKEIPKDRPDEAEGELAMADDTGPLEGLLEKKMTPEPAAPPPPPPPKPDPVPQAPEQERETIEAPRFIAGCRAPDVPPSIVSKALTIRIDVEMVIDARGKVTAAKVVEAHPLIPNELVLACVRAQEFEPAHLPDGTAVPYPFRRRFTFKPSQA